MICVIYLLLPQKVSKSIILFLKLDKLTYDHEQSFYQHMCQMKNKQVINTLKFSSNQNFREPVVINWISNTQLHGNKTNKQVM